VLLNANAGVTHVGNLKYLTQITPIAIDVKA
jgi:hypothetical protein